MKSLLRPLGDKILINPFPLEEESDGGIKMLSTKHHVTRRGVIVSIGIGSPDVHREVKVKDIVLFPNNSGLPIKLNGYNLIIIRECDIIATL